MDLLQLEHFLAVVEEGTFTRAAERVSRTQPAVSQSIKKLEEEIGGQLDMPRRTLMIYREQGYLSQAAREPIKIVRSFNWDSKVLDTSRRNATAAARAAAGLKGPRST
jgi:Bacterial regulatory helix-turn-helix protein, lysR family